MLTVAETAVEMSCSVRHVWRLIELGKLPYVNFGTGQKRMVRIDPSDISALKKSEIRSASYRKYRWS